MPRPRTSKPRDPELATLGAAIEAVIARSPNMTQMAVAHVAGLDVNQVNSYICGRVAPTYPNFRRLARGLGVEASALMAEIEAIEADGAARVAREPVPETVVCGVG
jgi:transcriptional regulator with XRE-family HTH domain